MNEVKKEAPCLLHEVKTPWIKNLGGVPAHLDYYQGSMYDKVAEIAVNYPDYIAYDFMGGKVKYRDFIRKVDECARALAGIGVKEGECRTRRRQSSCFMRSIRWARLRTWCTRFPVKRKLSFA